MDEKDCCEKCLGSYGFGKDNWGCVEKGCVCHKKAQISGWEHKFNELGVQGFGFPIGLNEKEVLEIKDFIRETRAAAYQQGQQNPEVGLLRQYLNESDKFEKPWEDEDILRFLPVQRSTHLT